MKNKLKFLIGMSLKKKIKTKSFVIANILICIAVVALFNIDHVINFFGGDFNEIQDIYVIDNTNTTYDTFKNVFDSLQGKESNYKIIKYEHSIDDAKKEIKDGKNPYVIVFNSSDNVFDVTMISKGYVNLKNTQIINTALNNTKVKLAIESSSITDEEINKIYSPVNIKREYTDKKKSSKDEDANMMLSAIFPVLILPFFMLTIFLVQMIGAEVNDEKSSRGMEIIISNVSPKIHFFSKVIAGNLFVLLQSALLLSYSGIGFIVRKVIGGSKNIIDSNVGGEITDGIDKTFSNLLSSSVVDKLIYIIPLVLVLMILTFIAYSILAGVLASMTTNTEDFQQLQTPIIIISLAGYYLAIMSNMFEGALFIRVLSYFPLLSAILSPTLLLLGQISVFDVIISIIIMILTNYLFIKYGLKIYKEGILNYTSKDLWKKMYRAVKR